MNKYFEYPNIDLWDIENWKVKINPLFGLIRKIGELPEKSGSEDTNPAYRENWDEIKSRPDYQYKSGSYDDPKVAQYWHERGMRFLSREGGTMRSVTLMPISAPGAKVPLLVVYHKEDYANPFWALRTLEHFSGYCQKAVEKRAYGIWFIVTNNMPDLQRQYCGMLHYDMTPDVDTDKIYLVLDSLYGQGIRLRDLTDFTYLDDRGTPADDPDAFTEEFDGHTVLNIAHRFDEHITPTFTSVTKDGQHDGTVDFQRIYHSMTGKMLMEGISLEFRNDAPDTPEAKQAFLQLGLQLESFVSNGSRWSTFKPLSLIDEPSKRVPLLAVFCGEQPLMTSVSFYYRYLQIAAQGECVVLFLSGKSLVADETPKNIIELAMQYHQIDKSRLYITGHSHWGHIAQLFMRKYPLLVAAVAALGNAPGIPLPTGSGEVIIVLDEDIDRISAIDMPTVIISGCAEAGCMFPINKAVRGFDPGINVEGYAATVEGRAEAWNRRLKASGCTQQPLQAIISAVDSNNQANRALGIPSDKADTLYLDGFEHYIADFKNIDGKYHLRIIGEENMPHVATPSQLDLAWSFMRQFARDQETGRIIEIWDRE